MILSYKEFTEPLEYTDTKDYKHQIMMSCYKDFKTIDDTNIIDDSKLEVLAKALQHNLVYSNIIWQNNHRRKDNAILNVDMLIFDIDNDLTIEEVHDILPFKIMTLTTTSHTPKHHKFRVFIPLEKKLSFTDSLEYTEFLKLVDTKCFKKQVDTACLEPARAYITTTSAQYKLNYIQKLFNPDELLEKAKMQVFAINLKKIPLCNNIRTRNKNVTIEAVKNYPKSKAIVSKFKHGNHYKPVYSLIGVGKKAGLSSEECAKMIMSYNIGREYSDFDDLVKKANTYN